MTELLQIVGAVLVLSGFAAAQTGRVDAKSIGYLVVNLVGAGVLAAVAVHGRDWGFLLLEGVWAMVSLVSLTGVLRRRVAGTGGVGEVPGRVGRARPAVSRPAIAGSRDAAPGPR